MRNFHSEGGEARTYSVSYPEAYETVLKVVRDKGLEVKEDNFEGRVIVAARGPRVTSFGDVIGFYFQKPAADHTEIRILHHSKCKADRYALVNQVLPTWEEKYHDQIGRALDSFKNP